MKGTITSSDEIGRLLHEGKRVETASILAVISSRKAIDSEAAEQKDSRIAVIAGKRLGNAVRRSRAKRRLREAARLAQAPWQGYDVVLVAREALLRVKFSKIMKDMSTIAATMTNTTSNGVKQ